MLSRMRQVLCIPLKANLQYKYIKIDRYIIKTHLTLHLVYVEENLDCNRNF